MDQQQAYDLLDDFRQKISSLELEFGGEQKFMSISVGLSTCDDKEKLGGQLTSMLQGCDELLQRAQDAGQDIVLYE